MSKPLATIFICAEERSGSEWLCDLMTNTGVLGRPKVYFDVDGMMLLHGQRIPDDLPGQIEYAHAQGITRNGVFSVKLLSWHFQDLWKHDWHKNFYNPHFVRLRRNDLLRQTISLARARQSQIWYHDHEQVAPIKYDYEFLKQLMQEIVLTRSRWDMFFAAMGVTPLTIYYESLMNGSRGRILEIADMVGQAHKIPLVVPLKTKRKMQRDMTTGRWRQMFLRDYKEETGYGT